MLPLRHATGWRIGSLFLLTSVIIVMVMPAPAIAPDIDFQSIPHADKWLHAAVFLVLALWFTGLYAKHSYWKVALGLLLFGGAIELVQRTLAYRTGDLADVLANLLGILAGLAIAVAGIGGWSLRVEERFAAWAAAR